MVNKRATLGFGGAGIFLVGVMLLDSHREALAQPYTESPVSASPASFLAQRPAAPAATTVQSFWAPAAVKKLWNGTIGGPSPPLISAGKPLLTLEAADAMASAAIAEARSKKFKDISVFVLDASTRVLVSKTMLNCPPLIPEIAHGKAGATVGTHSSSRALKDKYVPDRTPQLLAMTSIGGNSQIPFIAVPGGVLLRDGSNNVLGAIGVSGASADEDEHCAIVGAQSVGCVTEPAKSSL